MQKEVDEAGLLLPKKGSKGIFESKKDQSASLLFRSGTVNSSAIRAALADNPFSKTPKANNDNIQPTTLLPTPEKRKAFIFSGFTLKNLQQEDHAINNNLLHTSFATDRHNSELSHKTHDSKEKSPRNESIASGEHELSSPLRKKKLPILDLLNSQNNHTRRYSADLDKDKVEPRQKKLSTFAKREAVKGIDTDALQKMLLTLNNDKEQSPKRAKVITSIKEIHSVGIRTPVNEKSATESIYSGSMNHLNGESQAGTQDDDDDDDEGPGLISHTRSMIPLNLKNEISGLKEENNNKGNLLSVPKNEDSLEEIAASIKRAKNKRYSANPDEKNKSRKQSSITTLPESDGASASNKTPLMRYERSNFKKQTVIVTTNNPLLPTKNTPTERKVVDTKITEKMIKLRKEMNKKKMTIRLFEIIREKGKSMTNQPPYAKSNFLLF